METFKYSILENILKEGRLEDLITKYSSSLPEVWINELSDKDPSRNNKYLEWMVKEVIKMEGFLGDIEASVEKVVDATLCFHENVNRLNQKSVTEALEIDGLTPEIEKIIKSPKDINVYSVEAVELLCQYFEKNVSKSASRIKIYEDDRYLVVSPLTHKASCQYGAHSNWCVSTSNVTYYDRYTSDGILVFVIDNKSTNPKKPEANSYKFAIYVNYEDYGNPYNWKFFDMEDTEVSPALIISFLPNTILEKIKKYVEEFTGTLIKQRMVNEDELQKNCQFFIKRNITQDNGNIATKYVVFFDITNKSQIDYLDKKYNTNFADKIGHENFYFLIITQPENNVPTADMDTVSFSYAKNIANDDFLIHYTQLFNEFYTFQKYFIPNNFTLNDQELREFLDLYVKLFNSLNVTVPNHYIYVHDLKVGDEVVFRERYRRGGYGERLRVTRVAEKSFQLSNGKRLPRNPQSYNRIERIMDKKFKIIGGPLTNETKWVRKRIL